jgi:orotate phosphoribosyltransferase
MPPAHQDISHLFAERRGHFVFESGHHGDLWLELERLCLRPAILRPFAARLARWVREQQAEIACGPLNEGAFLALLVAAELDVEFVYTERFAPPPTDRDTTQLFPVEYRLPAVLQDIVQGRRVAIVNDVINAGSAVRGTAANLAIHGAQLVGITCLLTLGPAAQEFARQLSVPLHQLAARDMNLWTPLDCPLCRDGVPTDN